MTGEHTAMQNIVSDLASAAAVLGALVGYLPGIATVFAIIWYAIMIYDWMEHRGWIKPRHRGGRHGG